MVEHDPEHNPPGSEIIQTSVGSGDLARFDRLAAKRGVDRSELLRQAVDALLAQEALVGGFIPPPPAMLPPPRPQARRSAGRRWPGRPARPATIRPFTRSRKRSRKETRSL